jgi:hypothetical protein
LPVIGAMREGLADFADEAHKAGDIIQNSTIQALDDLKQKMDEFGTHITANMAGPLIAVLKLVDKITGGLASMYHFADAAFGAWIGGASANASINAASSDFTKRQSDQAAVDQAKIDRNKRRRDFTPITESDFSPVKGIGGYAKSSVNNLQQIGAYSGVDPIVGELKDGKNIAKQSQQSLKKIETVVSRAAYSATTTDVF